MSDIKLDLRLSETILRRIDRLAHLTGETRSRIVGELLEATCPLARPGELLVPLTVEILAAGVEAALAHRLSIDGLLPTFLAEGKAFCARATVSQSPVKEWLQYWQGDSFGPILRQAFSRGQLRAALRGSGTAQIRLTVAIEPAVLSRLSAWAEQTQMPLAALARLAMDPDFLPFGVASVRLDAPTRSELEQAAQAHSLSAVAEAGIWAWYGAFLYEQQITIPLSSRAHGRRDLVCRQVEQALHERPLLRYWRMIYRRLLTHPADQWLFARLSWNWPRDRFSKALAELNERVQLQDTPFYRGMADETLWVIRFVRPHINRPPETAPSDRWIQQQVEGLLALERELHAKGAEKGDDE